MQGQTEPVIILRGERLVAVDKPAAWLSVPSRWGERDARPVVGTWLQASLGQRVWPVHRLDEEATGLLLFALDAEAHAVAGRWFEQRAVAKNYEALTEVPASGVPPAGHVETWRSLLLRGKKRAYESPAGKPSETRARVVGLVEFETGGGREPALAWELEPLTGRPHQLRYELAHHGFPIMGDALYGARREFLPGAIALRCTRLRFLAADEASALESSTTLSAPSLAEWIATATTSP